MASATGTVDLKSRDGKSIKLDNGEWYGAFAPAQLSTVNKGDIITLEYNEKVGPGGRVYKNIVKVTGGSGAVPLGAGGQSVVGLNSPYKKAPEKPGEPLIHRDLTIIRQNAGNVAAPIVSAAINSGLIKTTQDALALLDTIMNHMADFSSGERDVKLAKAELAHTD